MYYLSISNVMMVFMIYGLMVVMDEKGNEKKWNHAEEQNKPTKISITEGSTRAVPNQHGPVLSPLQEITQFR